MNKEEVQLKRKILQTDNEVREDTKDNYKL